MRVVSLSSKNQITLPKHLLEDFHIQPRSKVFIKKAKTGILLEPVEKSVVDATAGSLTRYINPSKLGKSLEEIMEETKRIVAKELAEK